MKKRMSGILLAVLMLLSALPLQVDAAGSIDLHKEVSLTISYQDGDTPLVGAEFDIYQVASVDEYGELTTTEAFRQFRVDIRGENDEAWRTLASTLEGYVLRDAISPARSGQTDSQGKLVLGNNEGNPAFFGNGSGQVPSEQKDKLAQGLYLVLGSAHTQGNYIYTTEPFMVLLPTLDKEANDWVYEVTVSPKQSSRPVPEEPRDHTVARKVLKVWKDEGLEKERPREIIVQLLQDGQVLDTVTLNAANNWRYIWEGLKDYCHYTVVEKEPEDYLVTVTQEGITFVVTNTYDGPNSPYTPGNSGNSTLPQTGQYWWPVPVLFAAGLLFVVIGLIRRRGAEDEK